MQVQKPYSRQCLEEVPGPFSDSFAVLESFLFAIFQLCGKAIREQKRHIKLWHIKLCRSPRSPAFPVRYPDKEIYVPWVPKIAHKSLTPGHPTGRLPPPTGRSPAKKIYVYVPFSFLTNPPKQLDFCSALPEAIWCRLTCLCE